MTEHLIFPCKETRNFIIVTSFKFRTTRERVISNLWRFLDLIKSVLENNTGIEEKYIKRLQKKVSTSNSNFKCNRRFSNSECPNKISYLGQI